MNPAEVQLEATGTEPLLDLLRAALGREGIPPSRRRLAGWIEAGAVRVEGRVERDARSVPPAGSRVDLGLWPPDGRGAAGHEPRSLPLPVLHLDRHVLVVEHAPLPVADGELVARVRSSLDRAGLTGARLEPALFPPPDERVGGIVLATLSSDAGRRVEAAFLEGQAQLRLRYLACGAAPGDVRSERVGAVGSAGAVARLQASGAGPAVRPGRGPEGRRPLAAHVTSLRLPHPRTGRTLVLESEPPEDLAGGRP